MSPKQFAARLLVVAKRALSEAVATELTNNLATALWDGSESPMPTILNMVIHRSINPVTYPGWHKVSMRDALEVARALAATVKDIRAQRDAAMAL